jgi:UDP-N-acetylmuramyl pentapeptide phosphotransferase/UDP-N-acetylglucosamine-1-phosphate transferase
MKRRLSAYRMTPAGGALVFVFGAALIVLLIGPHHDERAAFIVLVVSLACFVMGAAANARSGRP